MVEVIMSGEILKTISRAITTLVSECRMHFLTKGIHSRAVDPSNVAMVIVDVPKESLESYRLESEKTIRSRHEQDFRDKQEHKCQRSRRNRRSSMIQIYA